MSFKFPVAADSFFEKLMKGGTGCDVHVDTKFEPYYYCLMAGLDARRLGAETDVGDEFVRDYVGDFQPYADLIAGLLIDAELARNSINADDRAAIEKKVIDILDPTSATKLSKDGSDLLNQYAAGGYKVIRDKIAVPPQSYEEFITAFMTHWNDK